jgi:hypothetical protein
MNHGHLNSKHPIRRELPGIVFLAVVLLGLGGFSFWAYGLVVSSARVCAAW